MSRYFESQADRYSLEHVGEADGLATALVKTADYRNPRPSLIEEVIFYDHPSVERRIYEAMLWKSAHATTIVPAPDSTESSHREFD
jgi:STE24 endopeptidase